PQYGARPLERAIQRHIEDRLSEALLTGEVKPGDTVEFGSDGQSLTIRQVVHTGQPAVQA
ncbi:MAG: hypothetical protein K6T26_08755, partial [Alicyclobacillus sp.]|nr:hypothetical protein [Alicyclobacillus sp.]